MNAPKCVICGKDAPFQSPELLHDGGQAPWYCFDHTPIVFSPPETQLLAVHQFIDRIRLVVSFIRASGKKPSSLAELFAFQNRNTSADQISLGPELERQVEWLESIARGMSQHADNGGGTDQKQ